MNSSLPPNFAMHGGVSRQQRQGLQGLVRQHGRQQGDISKQTPAVEEPIDGWLPWLQRNVRILSGSFKNSDTSSLGCSIPKMETQWHFPEK